MKDTTEYGSYEYIISTIDELLDSIDGVKRPEDIEGRLPELIFALFIEKTLITQLSPKEKLKVKIHLLEKETEFCKRKLRRMENDAT